MSGAGTDARAVVRGAARAQASQPLLVLVGGPPGAGKSLVADAVALSIGSVALHKDAFKEPLMTEFGVRSVADSERLSAAAVVSLSVAASAVLRRGLDVVLESTFSRDDRDRILALQEATGCALLQVHVVASLDVLAARWEERIGRRHAGHLDAQRLPEMRARAGIGTWDALPLDAPLVRVDTSAGERFDVVAWLEQLRRRPDAAATR